MKFRKKPVVIEATQWFKNGDHPLDDCRTVVPVPGDGEPFLSEGKVVRYFRRPDVSDDKACHHCGQIMHVHGWIDTKEGGHIVCPGDWIITGVQGEHYPCKPDIFAATYNPLGKQSEVNFHLLCDDARAALNDIHGRIFTDEIRVPHLAASLAMLSRGISTEVATAMANWPIMTDSKETHEILQSVFGKDLVP